MTITRAIITSAYDKPSLRDKDLCYMQAIYCNPIQRPTCIHSAWPDISAYPQPTLFSAVEINTAQQQHTLTKDSVNQENTSPLQGSAPINLGQHPAT